MARRNYFEILGLDFDPPEEDSKKIYNAIEKWEKKIKDSLHNEQNPARRKECSDELALKDDIVEVLNNKKERNKEAQELKKQKTEQLEKLLDIMHEGQTGILEVTRAQIHNYSKILRVKEATVEKIYIRKGFKIQTSERVDLNTVFLPTTIAKNINKLLEQLRSDGNVKYWWSSKVYDLFDFACYYNGGKDEDTENFKRKKTTELYAIMDKGAKEYATACDPSGHLLEDLFTAGTSQIFNSELNRKKYEQTLKWENQKGYFNKLHSVPDEFKRDRYFAESCIKTIQKNFSDFNLALALYNREASLGQEPYEPYEALVHITCGVCKSPLEFRTREDAEKGKCTACGAELYVKCPECGKKIPASADKCLCGFYISEMQFFDDYCKASKKALEKMDLPEAQRQLENARQSDPRRHSELVSLEIEINEKKKIYERPLNELRTLIIAKKYYTAQKLLGTIATKQPGLKFETEQKQILEKLATAEKMMPKMSDSDCGNRCIRILDIVIDYQPAIDMLEKCSPNKPRSLKAVITAYNPLTCTLTWSSSGDIGVSYCVVRKKNGIPVSHSDGTKLISSLTELEFKDKDIENGISYGYAVFAFRSGNYSDPVTDSIETIGELDSRLIKATAGSDVCHFNWLLPANCIGVRILRSNNNRVPPVNPDGSCTVITDNASEYYDDCTVKNSVTYWYRLQCKYFIQNTSKYSKGCTIMLTPEKPPVAVINTTVDTKDSVVFVRWNTPDTIQRKVVIREVINPIAKNMKGKLVPVSEMNTIFGDTYKETTSTANQCDFQIGQNTSIRFAVIVISEAETMGIVSDVFTVSHVEKIKIKEARFEGKRVKIILDNLSNKIEKIHYIIATKVDEKEKAPYANIDDFKYILDRSLPVTIPAFFSASVAKGQNPLKSLTKGQYDRDGMIVEELSSQTDLYLSVIGQYKMADGGVVYSDVSKKKINRVKKITYTLSWGGNLFFRRKRCKIYITTIEEETPELKLVYRSDGRTPMKLSDPNTFVLYTISESDQGFPDGYTLPDDIWEKIEPHTKLRLMLKKEDMAEYEIMPENIKTLEVPY